MEATTRFVVHGQHISENLQHHKLADVRRILEEKGFREQADDSDASTCHFHNDSVSAGDAKQTTISFDTDGFVTDNGVSHAG